MTTLLQKELAAWLFHDLPELGAVVSAVETSPDLRQATVYIRCPVGVDPEQAISLMKDRLPAWRRQIFRRLDVKFAPEITLAVDRSPAHVERLEQLFEQLASQDTDRNQA